MAQPMTLEETKAHIKHHGEMQGIAGNLAVKEGRMDEAKRCADRMECAKDEGMFLVGTPESRDPRFMTQHQKVIHSAQHHGLLKMDLEEPGEVG